jgi:hypothetical protein
MNTNAIISLSAFILLAGCAGADSSDSPDQERIGQEESSLVSPDQERIGQEESSLVSPDQERIGQEESSLVSSDQERTRQEESSFISPGDVAALAASLSFDQIKIYNHSFIPITARVDKSLWDQGSTSEFMIYPGSSESWFRVAHNTVRIKTYGIWHDFYVSPETSIFITSNFTIEIDDNGAFYEWFVFSDGPHIP